MNLVPEIHEATRRIVSILEKMQVPYAVGDAVAMAFGGYLRGTRDVDVLVLVPALRSQEFADTLNESGFVMRDEGERPIPVDVPRMAQATRELGQFRVYWNDTMIEIFSPKVPLQDSVLKRRLRVRIDFEMWITTTEDLILLKMIFHRPKDLEDVRRLLAANRESIDAVYVRQWIAKTLESSAGDELVEMMRLAEIAG